MSRDGGGIVSTGRYHGGFFFLCSVSGIYTTVVGYMIWNNLMKKYPATEVAPLSLFVPVSGVITSYLFLDERLSVQQLISVIVVITGIFIFLNSARIIKLMNSRSNAESQKSTIR
ncbi:EamA family transporter [Salmonella enterica]|nr:EamA family transporter [Salmonella enterica subsp. enterica serovar 4,[5],12:i:-]EGL5264178.1 EamA family transporter [Salmonella enterica]